MDSNIVKEESTLPEEVDIPDNIIKSNYFVPVTINGFCRTQAMLDNGATPAWVIHEAFLEKLGLEIEDLNKYSGVCSAANNRLVTIMKNMNILYGDPFLS